MPTPKPSRTAALSVACVLAASETLFAQTAPAPAPAPTPATPGLVNAWLREESDFFKPWDIGGQLRIRYENKDHFATAGRPGAIDFRDTGGNPNSNYLLLREKVHLGYSSSLFQAYVEGRDSSSHGDDRNPNPDSDTFDLHQAYVVIGNAKKFPLLLKVGRQELVYGDERLVGAFDWGNLGRVFDAAKLRLEMPGFWIDAFTSKVVIPNDNEFNMSNEYDTFSGLYGSTRSLLKGFETQAYFLARNTERQSPTVILPAPIAGHPLTGPSPRDIYTVGARLKSLPGALGNWDTDLEGAFQFGRFKTTAASASLDQEAFAVHAAGGYTWKETWGTPRAGLEYNFASGDSNAADGKHETFENLFPTNHKFYGFMDFVSWQNIHDFRLATSLKPLSKLTLTGDLHAFFLADTHDSFYTVAGAPRAGGGVGTGTGYAINPTYGSYVGSEIDLVATYALRFDLAAQLGYGHFFVGDYVKDSLRAPAFGASDADWVYLQLSFNF